MSPVAVNAKQLADLYGGGEKDLFHVLNVLRDAGQEPGYRLNEDAAKYRLYLNVPQQVLTAYAMDEEGEYTRIVRRMLCTTGKSGSSTPTGTYAMDAKEQFGKFSNFDNEYARYWTQVVRGIYMHSIMFRSRDVASLKESPYNALGKRASHGCIRLYVEDAKWIYYHCPQGTLITIGKYEPVPVSDAEKKGITSTMSYEEYLDFQAKYYDPMSASYPNAWVTVEEAQLRTGHGSNDRLIRKLEPGTELKVLQIGQSWIKVEHEGREGYVKRAYVSFRRGEMESVEEGRITRRTTSMYEKPKTRSEEICILPKDVTLEILEELEDGWLKIRYWTQEGYIQKENTKLDWAMDLTK